MSPAVLPHLRHGLAQRVARHQDGWRKVAGPGINVFGGHLELVSLHLCCCCFAYRSLVVWLGLAGQIRRRIGRAAVDFGLLHLV